MEIDGSNEIMLTGYVEDRAPSWSVYGDEIVFSSTREADHSTHRIFRIDAEGKSEVRFPVVGRDPVDLTSKELLFAGILTYEPGKCGIIWLSWGRKTGSGEIVSNAESRLTDSCDDLRPDVHDTQVIFMRKVDGRYDVWRNNADSSTYSAVNLTPDTWESHDTFPVFSPDGGWIAFASNRGGRWRIYVIKADGTGEPTVLIEPPVSTNFSNWDLSRLSWEQ